MSQPRGGMEEQTVQVVTDKEYDQTTEVARNEMGTVYRNSSTCEVTVILLEVWGELEVSDVPLRLELKLRMKINVQVYLCEYFSSTLTVYKAI